MLGLPDNVRALLFDLDGVLTPTAVVHNKAWKEMFDAFLKARADKTGEPFREFTDADYGRYVDGRPRADGVRTFLASRGIELPEGTPDDEPGAETVNGLGNRKNERVLDLIRQGGVKPYPGSLAYLRAAKEAGLRRAVVSSSANTAEVLTSAGIADLLEERVDGLVARELGLPGKPAPDTFLEGARRLGVDPADAVVFEDALAGVEAGRAGRFGYVVGVNRVGDEQREQLGEHGADRVVDDLSELL